MANLAQVKTDSILNIPDTIIPNAQSLLESREAFAYEIMRHQKESYSEPREINFPAPFLTQIKIFAEKYPLNIVTCRAYFFNEGSDGAKLPRPHAGNILHCLTKFGVPIIPELHAEFLVFMINCQAPSVEYLIQRLLAHLLVLELNDRFLCLFDTNLPIYAQVTRILEQYMPRRLFQTFSNISSTPPNELKLLAPQIFTWISGRTGSIQLFKEGRKPIFMRNDAGEPIIFREIAEIESIIERGAMTFIPDSCVNVAGKWYIDLGCVDIDLKGRIDYGRNRARVLEYIHFLQEEVQISPILTHSGNRSFHVRFFLTPCEMRGYFLPRKRPFESFIRRINDELGVTKIHDAIEIVTMAYNCYTRLGQVMRRGTRLREFFFDNRTGINTGARCPGSWRASNTLSRCFSIEDLPEDNASLKQELDAGSLFNRVERGELSLFEKPQVDLSIQARNTNNLVKFARDFIESKLEPYWDYYAGSDTTLG